MGHVPASDKAAPAAGGAGPKASGSSLAGWLARHLPRWIPDPFVFALALTLLVGGLAIGLTGSGFDDAIGHWYRGFWMLLEFGMQMVLLLATGYAIALSPAAGGLIDRLGRLARTPAAVYALVLVAGALFGLVSWGWAVLTAVLARELARRTPGVDYAYLVACVYLSSGSWVAGLSSSIPLLMGTEGNFLIESGVIDRTVPTSATLGTWMNAGYVALYLLPLPLLMWWLRPATAAAKTFDDLRDAGEDASCSVQEEAERSRLGVACASDRLNHGFWLQGVVAAAAIWVVARHFATNGFALDLNIMIFLFLALGMLVHRTPMRFVVAMKRACSNISGIVFQYPFYAGIMGLMMFSGLGALVSEWLVGQATIRTLPLVAQFSGALVNFAIPSAGGEWAVIGPSLTQAALELGSGLPEAERQALVARTALAAAYGETSTNLLQPFFLLVILPVMGAGVSIQARDVMGFLVLPFLLIYAVTAVLVTFAPM